MNYPQQGYQPTPPPQQAVGVVEAISTKGRQNPYQTRSGMCYNLKFKLNGAWYQLPFCELNGPEPLQRGQNVSFQYEVKSSGTGRQYFEVIKKTMNTQGYQPPPQQSQNPGYQQGYNNPQQQYPQQQYAPQPQQQPQRNSQKNPGMCVGQALNMAAALSGPGVSLEQVEALAWQIIDLNDRMNDNIQNGQYGGQQAPVQQPGANTPPNPQAGGQPLPQQQSSAAPPQQQGYLPQQGQYPQQQQNYQAGNLPAGFSNPQQ